MTDKKNNTDIPILGNLEECPQNIKQIYLDNGRILIAVNSEGKAISLAFVPK